MKIKLLIFSLFSLLNCTLSQSQAPTWTSYAYRTINYPEAEYLIGFMSEKNTTDQPQDEVIQRLIGYCKDQVAENIVVDIQSISTLNIHSVNTNTLETYKRNSSTVSNATIPGMKIESYYDQRKKIAYAIAYAKRKDVIQYYANDISSQIDKLNSNFTLAQNQINNGENEKALKNLYQLQTLLNTLEYDFTMLITLTGEYNHPNIDRTVYNKYKKDIDSQLSSIKNASEFDVVEAAFYIAYALNLQVPDKSTPVIVNNFTYQDTKMGSSFSRLLKNNLEQKLIQQNFKVIDQANANEGAMVINGNYWEMGDKINITAIARSIKSAVALASSTCAIPKDKLIASGVSFKPENYAQAMVNMKMFAEDEIVGGDLKVEVFTNKGTDNLIFTEGETLKLSVRANKECYIRFIYHAADGSKVLLLDSYYLNLENVNKVFELPYEFECTEPYGVETLQLNAQSTPFEPLTIKREYGFDFIVDDTQSIVSKTRGFKKKEKSDTDFKAEKRLVFTTMSR